MKISINPSLCVGSGQCVRIAPKVFDQNEQNGVVVVLEDEPSGREADAAREAAMSCPVAAIQVEEP